MRLEHLAHAPDRRLRRHRRRRVQHVRAARDDLPARAALPDARRLALDVVLPTKDAVVLRVLAHLHLLDVLPDGRAIPNAVLAADPDLLRALAHVGSSTV